MIFHVAYIFIVKNVLLIDSGSGGVNVLVECVKLVPSCNFLLLCDNVHSPYGNKSREKLIEITKANLQMIEKFFKFEIVIFACNTLTATVIDFFRKEYPDVVFIGTEPAIAPALREFEEKDVLVMATPTTLASSKLISGLSRVQLCPFENLAREIDLHLDSLSPVVEAVTDKLKDFSAKAVVLGCTHYVAIAQEISKALGGAKIFSGESGVARRLKSLVGGTETNFQVQIMTTKDDDLLAKILSYFRGKLN